MGFYHRNTTQERKDEILHDLKIPMCSDRKKLQCVVATISLGNIIAPMAMGAFSSIFPCSGVGVDIRVANTLVLGLSENMESLMQESGRSMRGAEGETQGLMGFSFFLHKGALGEARLSFSYVNKFSFLIPESKHCPPSSQCRALISKPLKCQTKIILDQFDQKFSADLNRIDCNCCFSCISKHCKDGCLQCQGFIEKFFPVSSKVKVSKSVAGELKAALHELFVEMNLECIKVEGTLDLDCSSFIRDVLKMVDELRSNDDILKFWHVSEELARKVYSVTHQVIFEDIFDSSSEEEAEDIDEVSNSSDSELESNTSCEDD